MKVDLVIVIVNLPLFNLYEYQLVAFALQRLQLAWKKGRFQTTTFRDILFDSSLR